MHPAQRRVLIRRIIALAILTFALSGCSWNLDPSGPTSIATGLASTSYTTGATAGVVQIQAKHSALPAVYFDITVTP